MWQAIKAEKFQLAILASMIIMTFLIFLNTYTLNDHWKLIMASFNQSKSNYDFLNATNQEIDVLNHDHNIILIYTKNISDEEQQIVKILNTTQSPLSTSSTAVEKK